MKYYMEGATPIKWSTEARSETEALVKFAQRFGMECIVSKVTKVADTEDKKPIGDILEG